MRLALALFLLLFLVLWAVLYRVLPAVWKAARSVWAAAARAILRRQRVAVWYERGAARLQPLHPYRPLIVILAVGFLTAGATGAAFLDLAELMQARSPDLERVDHAVWESAHRFRSPGLTTFFVAFTFLGTGVGLGILVALVAAGLVARAHPLWAAYLVVTAFGGWLLNQGLKLVFERARPDMAAALRKSYSYAFPSGHAMVSLIVFGALVYLVIRAWPSWKVRSASVALALCLTAAISLSRIYLGVHWVSDIAAGWSAGAVWLVTTWGTYEIFRRMRLMRAARTAAVTVLPSEDACPAEAPERSAEASSRPPVSGRLRARRR